MSNLVTRTISGAVFLAVILASLLWRAEAFGAVFLFITVTMMAEYIRISTGRIRQVPQFLTLAAGAAFFCISFCITCYGLDPKWLAAAMLPVLLIVAAVLLCRPAEGYDILPYLLASILYIAVPFSSCTLAAFGADHAFDATPLLCIMIMLWCSDIGAYLSGMSLHKVFPGKLCPSISPKKTVVGYVGGLVLTLLAGWILSGTGMMGCGLFHALMLALIVNVAGTFGDLAESQFKRRFKVKDSGTIMPGHGGLLDRFDGALLSFPAAVAYILLTDIQL